MWILIFKRFSKKSLRNFAVINDKLFSSVSYCPFLPFGDGWDRKERHYRRTKHHSSWTVIYHCCWTIESAKLVVHFVRVETQLESSVNHRQQLFINKELIPKCSVYFFILPAYMGAAERKLMNHDGYPSDKNECELKGEKIFFQEALFNFHHQSPHSHVQKPFFCKFTSFGKLKKVFHGTVWIGNHL